MQGPHFYYSGGKKVPLQPSDDSLVVAYKEEVPPKDLDWLIKGDEELARVLFSEDLRKRNIVVFKRRAGVKTSLEDFAARISRSDKIAYVSPLYYAKDNPVIVTDEFIVCFKPGVTREAVEQLNAANDVEYALSADFGLGPETYLLRWRSPAMRGALDMANRYYETGLTEYSVPDFIRPVLLASPFTPNDPFFPFQWHLPRIKAPEAWDITRGDPSIIIAVIDQGVDTGHEDFAGTGKFTSQKDFFSVRNLSNPLNGATPQSPDEFHGTVVSGLIAANGNNGRGVTGVAPNCRLMALRVFADGPNLTLVDSRAAAAIRFAANNGASVISNSWGLRELTDPLRKEMDNALTNGRGGKGCVILHATGNENLEVSKANPVGAHENVIAVGAHNDKDVRSGYSNFGPEVDICAPSDGTTASKGIWKVLLKERFQEDGSTRTIVTTDLTGPLDGMHAPLIDREDPLNITDNYTSLFNGTSAACPQAAGVAALMLSVNPDLTQKQVRFLLEATADKVNQNNTDATGKYQPNGHSEWYGFGRVNAFEAVKAARSSVEKGDFIQKVEVKLKRESGDRFVSTTVLRAIDGRQRRSDTATDSFVRSGGDGFLQMKFDLDGVTLTEQRDVDER